MNLKNSSTCPRRCEWSRLLRNLQKVMAIPGRPAQFDWQQTHSEIAWGKWCLLTSNKSKRSKKNKKDCCVVSFVLSRHPSSSKIISNTEKTEAKTKTRGPACSARHHDHLQTWWWDDPSSWPPALHSLKRWQRSEYRQRLWVRKPTSGKRRDPPCKPRVTGEKLACWVMERE